MRSYIIFIRLRNGQALSSSILKVLGEMQVNPQDAVVIGDSVRRDLGGATAAGMSCILVGGARHPFALESVASLIDVVDSVVKGR